MAVWHRPSSWPACTPLGGCRPTPVIAARCALPCPSSGPPPAPSSRSPCGRSRRHYPRRGPLDCNDARAAGIYRRRSAQRRAHFSLAGSSMKARCWAKVPSSTSTARVDGGTLAPQALSRDVANEGARLQRLHERAAPARGPIRAGRGGCRAAWTGVVSARHGMLRCRKEGSRGAASGRKPALSSIALGGIAMMRNRVSRVVARLR